MTARPRPTGRTIWSVLFSAVAFVSVGVAVPSPAFGAPPDPGKIPAGAVSPSQVAPGASVFVSGSAWPASTEISVAVCGAEARHGSGDCDLPSSTIVGSGTNGVFGTQLVIQIPPKPCPCVVQIAALGDDARELTIPIVINGAPEVALPPLVAARATDPLTIEAAHLTGGSWTDWFGWPARRTLVLRVKNTSGAPVNQPLVLVAAGRGSDASEPQAVPDQRPFATGEDRVIRVPVDFAAPTFGDYGVRVRLGSDGATVTKQLVTSSYPWGLFIVVLLIVQGILLLIRNRVRARVAPVDPPEELDAPVPDREMVGASAGESSLDEPIRWRMPIRSPSE